MADEQHAFPSGSNLGAIVARMQERALVVTKEEDELHQAKENLQGIQKEYLEVSIQQRDVRVTYLRQQVEESTAELTSISSAKEMESREKQADELQQKASRIRQLVAEDVEQWENGIQREVMIHRVRQQLYLCYLKSVVKEEEGVIQQRSDRLALVRELDEGQNLEIQQLREQDQYLRNVELPQAKEHHGEANAQADLLAKRVRAAIETRSSIRDKLRERQEHYEKVQKQSDELAAEFRS